MAGIDPAIHAAPSQQSAKLAATSQRGRPEQAGMMTHAR
jgi:hypothetical protein